MPILDKHHAKDRSDHYDTHRNAKRSLDRDSDLNPSPYKHARRAPVYEGRRYQSTDRCRTPVSSVWEKTFSPGKEKKERSRRDFRQTNRSARHASPDSYRRARFSKFKPKKIEGVRKRSLDRARELNPSRYKHARRTSVHEELRYQSTDRRRTPVSSVWEKTFSSGKDKKERLRRDSRQTNRGARHASPDSYRRARFSKFKSEKIEGVRKRSLDRTRELNPSRYKHARRTSVHEERRYQSTDRRRTPVSRVWEKTFSPGKEKKERSRRDLRDTNHGARHAFSSSYRSARFSKFGLRNKDFIIENIVINSKIINLAKKNDIKDLIDYCDKNIGSFNGVNLSTALHRIAKNSKTRRFSLSVSERECISRLTKEVLKITSSLASQNIANIAWAFATLKIKDEKLFKALAREAKKKICSFCAQEVSNIAWAFAALKIKDESLFKALAIEFKKKRVGLKAQAIANTAWAFATLKINDEPLFRALADQALKKNNNFKPQNISNIAWAFATLEVKNERLFEVLAKEAKRKMCFFDEQAIANTAWSFAILNIKDESFFKALTGEFKKKICFFGMRAAVNLLWTSAVVNVFDEQFLQLFLKKFDPQKLLQKHLIQLQYVYLYHKLEKKDVNCVWPDSFIQAFSTIEHRKTTISNLHLDVERTIKNLGYTLKNECPIGHMIVDIFIEEIQTIVEVEGPSHFLKGTREFRGNTVFKHDLLKKMGMKVLSVCYFEWNQLETPEEKMNYIKKNFGLRA